jgi:preprotein translocase subunit SecY
VELLISLLKEEAMFGKIGNIFKIPDLRNKILFTAAMLAIYRIGFSIPIPGYDPAKIAEMAASRSESALGQVAAYMQMFTGGTLQKSSLFGLGIMPYITASIILMLLGEVWPTLRKLRQEGQAGQKKIQEYTRYLTVPICIIQAIMYSRMLGQGQFVYEGMQDWALMMSLIGMTAGTLFLMWIGEQIDEYGIGNGISILIMAGILSRMPWAVKEVWDRADLRGTGEAGTYGPTVIAFIIVAFVFVVAGAILITQGQRRIPIQQAKQMRGRKMFGGSRHYLPLRVNHGGVMPVIFASSFMMFPTLIFSWLKSLALSMNSEFWSNMMRICSDSVSPGNWVYTVLYVILIFLFAYFWTTVQFQPKDMAKRLRDTGSFIPGLRPGHRTAEYLETVMSRITFYGAAFLAFIAVTPGVIATSDAIGISWRVASFLGGTGLLIVVSVSLDLVQRIESNLIMHNYEGFSDIGRIKGAYS